VRTTTMTTALAIGALAALGGVAHGAGQSQWADQVDNPYFPLEPGTTWVYRGTRDGAPTRDVQTVTDRKITIQGAPATVVHDALYVSGRLFERTDDYYAQDRQGNVHYLGEDTAELDKNGNVTSTEGSFRAGVDGAEGGIIMLAHPRPGDSYRQEFYRGHAEDQARVLKLNATVTVPFGTFSNALKTEETSRLDPGVVEHKWYAKGIGEVKAQDVRGGTDQDALVSMTTPGDQEGDNGG
jgi:hypothetical protein